MIDFSTLKGLTIPEGEVIQITDANGNVLWKSTFTFKIDGVSYEAESGMCFMDWVDSPYNTAGFICNGENSMVYNSTKTHYITYGDFIVEGGFPAIEENLEFGLKPKPITFTIDGTLYEAEYGMLWWEWAESEYDVDGFMLADKVYHPNGRDWVTGVTPYDVINEGEAYTITSAGATITITGGNNYTYVVIDGVTYNSATELIVPVGTVITCVTHNSSYGGSIKLNYERVAQGSGTQYEYTVTSNATIAFKTIDPSGYGYAAYGEITIIDENAPIAYKVTTSITGGYNAGASVVIDGVSYSGVNSVDVPAGTVVTCSAQYAQGTGGSITLNGETVASRPNASSTGYTTYEYTVVRDVQIVIGKYRQQTGMSSFIVYGTIAITEL